MRLLGQPRLRLGRTAGCQARHDQRLGRRPKRGAVLYVGVAREQPPNQHTGNLLVTLRRQFAQHHGRVAHWIETGFPHQIPERAPKHRPL